MSRIGSCRSPCPPGSTCTIDGRTVTVKGPKGTLSHTVVEPITVEREEPAPSLVTRPDDERRRQGLHGLSRTLLNNMVVGVTAGYEKTLEIVGVGYRVARRAATWSSRSASPTRCWSPRRRASPSPSRRPTRFSVEGIDKQLVGEVAANIRKLRKPDPYKGKGVRYAGEVIRRKVGKTGK